MLSITPFSKMLLLYYGAHFNWCPFFMLQLHDAAQKKNKKLGSGARSVGSVPPVPWDLNAPPGPPAFDMLLL
jgi:hypothetical protein